MAPQIDSSNNLGISADEVDKLVTRDIIKNDSLPPQTSGPAMTAAETSETKADAAAVEDNAAEEESNNEEDSQYNDFVEFVDFLDYLKAPPEYDDFIDFINAPPTSDEVDVSVDFLDFLKSAPKPEEASKENASEKDDWASLLEDGNEDAEVVDDISWSGIVEGKPKTQEDGTKENITDEDSITSFIASLESKHGDSDNPATEADFAAFLDFFNALSTDEKATAIRTVRGADDNKESAEAIWSDILTGMQKGVNPGDIPQSWFGYVCELFTQSLTKVQPEPEKGSEEDRQPQVATMV